MPKKNFITVRLPVEQPDMCVQCPLLGLIPKEQARGKYNHVCIGTCEAMTRQMTKVSMSQRQEDVKHRFHRPCDQKWVAWTQNPLNVKREFNMSIEQYYTWRLPFEQTLQLRIIFPRKRDEG